MEALGGSLAPKGKVHEVLHRHETTPRPRLQAPLLAIASYDETLGTAASAVDAEEPDCPEQHFESIHEP